MNRSLLLLSLVVLVAVPCSAQTQKARPLSVGFSGGLSLPMSDLGESAESGYSVAGHIFLKQAATQKIHLRGDVSYDKWSATKLPGSNIVDGAFTNLAFVANVIVSATGAKSSMHPYLLAGGGLYRTNLQVAGSTQGLNSESSDMGIQVGGGVEFKLSGFSTFLEAKYVNVFRDPTSWTSAPITFGVRF